LTLTDPVRNVLVLNRADEPSGHEGMVIDSLML